MEKLLDNNFWLKFIENLKEWIINEFPGIVILTILFLITLKLISVAFKKIKKTLIKRVENDTDEDPAEATKRVTTLVKVIHSLIKIIIVIIFIMMLLPKVGVNIAPVLAGAGILGLAIGFGAQELVRDFISGFFIILEDQIRTGDVAVINGTGGLVEKIQLRTTTLRDFSGTMHIFQNGKITTIANMTKEWSAIVFDIGVAYKEDTQTVIDIMKKVGDELSEDPNFKESIIEPIEVFGLDNFASSAIVIKARIKTKPIQQWSVGREYRKRLKYAFDEHNIEIPFPHTTVYWGDKINPLKLDVENSENLSKN
jgi:small conductance mechanosensitive channel